RAGLVLLAGGLIAASVHALMQTTPFPVQKVEVRGTKRLTHDEIVALAGVAPGQNLLALRLKSIGQQVSSNPWVASVRVQRFFPGTIAVSISERQPVAVINMGLLYYLDDKGEPFKPLSFGDSLDFPVVTGIAEDDLSNDPATTKDALKTACNLIEALKQHGSFILADVSEIHYDRGHGFTLYTTAGALPVKIGTDDFDKKLQRFARIYQNLMTQQPGLQYIDLDYSDRIVVKKG
ncbi:MAG: FtsQ-type POTRA domain-containing protein, partial [Geobacter sp.]|nr:FtsQ-type POTRA domain-containing protein [Geobacter sp.]